MTRPLLPDQVSPPELALSGLSTAAIVDTDVVAVCVTPGPQLASTGADVAAALGVDLLEVVRAHRMTGAVGEVATVPAPGDDASADRAPRLVLLLGVGDARPADLRHAGAALARAVTDRDGVAVELPSSDPAARDAFVAGVTLGSFSYNARSTGPEKKPVRRVVLAGAADDEGSRAGLRRAVAIARAGWRSRFLATVPSNIKSPAWLAEQAVEVAERSGLACRVWDEADLDAEGFGGILAVGRASATPPRLIRLDYTPAGLGARAAAKLPRVALVGKGITFDSGGLSIKPGQAMASMKRDMTGGAVVIAVLAALADVGCPVRVTGLVPAAENVIAGNALRPGDVVRHWGGRTTEVTNTDAEGRLVLADAMAYAATELDPAVLVDVATLTGGIKVALGQQVGGLFATDDALASALLAEGEAAGEPLWRMPIHRAYEDRLASKIADADNSAPSGPQAIMAALFLRHFTDGLPWAHLDIASVGDVEQDRHEWTAGPSGFGSRLLLGWLGRPEPLAGITA